MQMLYLVSTEIQFTSCEFCVKKSLKQSPYITFAIRTVRTARQTIYDLSCHENILSSTNEMQFTDRKKFFTDRLSLLRSVRSVRIDKPYMTSLAMKIVSPTKRCSSERTVKRFFTDRISLLRSARSVRIGKPCMTSNEMQFTDPISLLRSVRSGRRGRGGF